MSSLSPENHTNFIASNQHYELQRYPVDRKGQLRAWDAADSYLLSLLDDMNGSFSRLCIVNDNFGALTIPLLSYLPVGYGDSWMSYEAIRENLKANLLSNDDLDYESDLESLVKRPDVPDLVIGRVPKSKSQLSYLLSSLNVWVQPGCVLLLAGMDKHLSKGQYDLLEKYFGPASFLPGVKKARVWKATVDKALGQRFDVDEFERANQIQVPNSDLSLSSLPNVFSNDHLDIGSRFFLEHFASLPESQDVADLACGNGVLGLAYLRRFPSASMSFYDESFQAIKSARSNLLANQLNENAKFVAGDGVKSAESKSLDLILCNPPFHQQNAVNTSITQSFFREAKRTLKANGELWIVANRHLGYHADLKRVFGNFENVAGNKKFVILKAKTMN